MMKTIIFDLGGVYFTDGVKRFVTALHEQYGLDPAQAKKGLEDPLASLYRMGKVSGDEFWNEMKKRWKISEKNDALAILWHKQYVPIEGTVQIVDKLKKGGFELLFLSDNIPERVAYLDKKYGFSRHFSDGIFSHHIGARKPDIKMYEEVLKKTHSKPQECVFIDDKEKNLPPARKLGMQAILFKTPEELVVELKKLRITI